MKDVAGPASRDVTDAASGGDGHAPSEVVLVVDVANVMGSRPDGWWRDRLGAATRLLAQVAFVAGSELRVDGANVRVARILAVVEGQARPAIGPEPLEVVRAAADGDTTIAVVADQLVADGLTPLVVTADRGLRARLSAGALVCGPRTLLDALH